MPHSKPLYLHYDLSNGGILDSCPSRGYPHQEPGGGEEKVQAKTPPSSEGPRRRKGGKLLRENARENSRIMDQGTLPCGDNILPNDAWYLEEKTLFPQYLSEVK